MTPPVTLNVSAEDLQPLQMTKPSTETVLPSRSFWQTVSCRLANNPRAWFSFFVIAMLLLAITIGPFLWPQSASQQWLGEISAAPSVSRSLPVAVKQLPTKNNVTIESFTAVEASTEAVYLFWPSVMPVNRYQIYRHERQPRDQYDLGLPLADLPATSDRYVDSLNLREKTYWYTLLAIDSRGEKKLTTVEVKPYAAIDFMQAQLQGLIPADARPEQWQGRTVILPGHPLGTDALGRDLLARLLEGGRTSLFIGFVAPLIFVLCGALYGATTALLGGHYDNWMMRFADFVVALPFLLFMILIRIAAGIQSGESGVNAMLLALVLLSWPTAARLVRAQVLQLKHEPYIQSARLGGASTWYLVYRHLLPNVLAVILVTLSFAIPQAIFIEAFLSFIGMGVTPPTASWGSLCQEGLKTMLTYPRELLWPAGCIALTVLAFNLLGDALRDALDLHLEPSP